MRIGTNLMLLPLADPVRLAEDAATLSILTGGRFDLGVGFGYRQLEFDYFGRKLSQRPSLMEEGVAIIRQAWSGEPVQFAGKRFRIDGSAGDAGAESGAAPVHRRHGGAGDRARGAPRRRIPFYRRHRPRHVRQGARRRAAKRVRKARSAPDTGASSRPIRKRRRRRSGRTCCIRSINTFRGARSGRRNRCRCFPTRRRRSATDSTNCSTAMPRSRASRKCCANIREIVDVHFWAQFPGESVDSGSARIEYIARNVIPRVRANLSQ